MGTILSTVAAVLVGGAMATATIVGVVSSQTQKPDQSPVSVTDASQVVGYGSTN
ncbi:MULTISPECIES: hypothetical protein [Nocardioides]|uniref:DUF2613 family protein n=1 Tax=Nocardioides kribbensis TaxID=305517 RepID=A0ABV1NVP0_9ACTN|nr:MULTISPECIES: hypothetical protein [Nocardioides]MBJ7529604.1 hypothetical protein [Nocardioides sp.]MCM3513980.1 hypothetical protein [Nocardioides sp. P86]